VMARLMDRMRRKSEAEADEAEA
ncbi:MAG: hypothetical protein RL580_1244, partial [Pseudomonadota bacterium]